jgi:hypothetical protein
MSYSENETRANTLHKIKGYLRTYSEKLMYIRAQN